MVPAGTDFEVTSWSDHRYGNQVAEDGPKRPWSGHDRLGHGEPFASEIHLDVAAPPTGLDQGRRSQVGHVEGGS